MALEQLAGTAGPLKKVCPLLFQRIARLPEQLPMVYLNLTR